MSDNIVKHGQLKDIAQDLWNKAKARDIERISYDSSAKKIKATNSQTPALELEAELTNLVAIDERAKFQQDVSVDKAGSANNLHIGPLNSDSSHNRILGYRGLTSASFVDNYVSELIVCAKSNATDGDRTNWKVWAIKKGARQEEDTVFATYHKDNVQVETIPLNGQSAKCVRFAIGREFNEEIYFMVQCTSGSIKVCNPTSAYHSDVVNLSEPPSDAVGSTIRWTTNVQNSNTAIIQLIGRESISSLAEKIRNTQADSSKYVLQSETTNTGGEIQYAGKVVKLGTDGKINSNMIPEIAINRVLQATNKDNALHLIGEGKDRLQVGDVVVLQDTSKIYIYKGRPDGETRNDFNRDFLEISMGNGTVKTVNSVAPDTHGNVSIDLANLPNVQAELNKKISEITLKSDKKHLTITKATGATSELDLTSAFAAANISYSGQIGTTTKNNVQEAIDALNTEVNRGVKSIKSGTPGPNGDIDVTATQGGTGISMRFGTNGTPVEIATYMTTEEVNQIKALFT